jgi:DNA polymerase-3 subunit delta'
VTPLHGHDAAVAAFLDSHRSGRLHHAWLLSGPQGIGKALFADKAALKILADAAGPPVDMPGLDTPTTIALRTWFRRAATRT